MKRGFYSISSRSRGLSSKTITQEKMAGMILTFNVFKQGPLFGAAFFVA